jgi:hypothetical protein
LVLELKKEDSKPNPEKEEAASIAKGGNGTRKGG